MSRSLATLDQEARPYFEYLVDAARTYLGPTTITSTRRTWTEQARLYQDYLAGHRSLPALPPERSLHVYGLAVDLVVGRYAAGGSSSPEMTALGTWWRSLGGRWGGPGDPVHFSV
ncbi:MAG: hypothetical protein ACRDV9_15005 [Acidimicrobiia bacterium]